MTTPFPWYRELEGGRVSHIHNPDATSGSYVPYVLCGRIEGWVNYRAKFTPTRPVCAGCRREAQRRADRWATLAEGGTP